jgi:negative regulator of sigma E activity
MYSWRLPVKAVAAGAMVATASRRVRLQRTVRCHTDELALPGYLDDTAPHRRTMNPLLQPTPSRSSPAKSRKVRPFWVASAGWVIAAMACATVAMANVPLGDWQASPSAPDASVQPVAQPLADTAASDVPSPAAQAPSKLRARCQTCGVVESIRQLAAHGESPARYEFTVRLRNGSALVSSEAYASYWRVGDSIMLIGGEQRANVAAVSL